MRLFGDPPGRCAAPTTMTSLAMIDGAARAGGRVENAVDHQRRPLQIELGTRSEEVRLEAPGDLEGLEVVLVNLIERRVTRARQIAAVGPPFARFRFHLTSGVSRTLTKDAGVHRDEREREREEG